MHVFKQLFKLKCEPYTKNQLITGIDTWERIRPEM